MREIDINTFAAQHAGGHTVIDVREPMEYVAGHVPGARLIPMGQITVHDDELPRDVPVYVICASGNRSLAVADFLVNAGVDAWSVSGGTGAWARAGRSIVTGEQPNAANAASPWKGIE